MQLHSDHADVALVGELDLATTGMLEQALSRILDARPRRIVIDLRQLEFVDSTGLRCLLGVAERARRGGWELSLIPGRENVQRIFELTGTSAVLPFTDAALRMS